MPNPDAVSDAAGEWIELWANSEIDLNGLQLGVTFPEVDATIASAACITIPADSYALLARVADMGQNGGLPAVDATFSFNVTNSGPGLFIAVDDMLLDAVAYSSSGTGVARSLDPDAYDPAQNDADANWCPATDAYGAGDLGTPGLGGHPQCQ
jgi:hypothetical protein